MGKVCVAGAGDVSEIDYAKKTLKANGVTLKRRTNQHQRLDGDVFNGLIKTADSELKQVWSTRP